MKNTLIPTLLCCAVTAHAQLGTLSNNIKVDQFGYYPNARKVAVVAQPVIGFNVATEGSYLPGLPAGSWQVRRWGDNAVMLSGMLTPWNNGAVHTQSGDIGWWFDFSGFNIPGSYYLYDVINKVRSYRFEIGVNVYNDVLKAAIRTFFYQRINHAKPAAYAGANWADGAAFEGAQQDRAARSLSNNDPKDLSGGWADAGDYNKYVTFASTALLPLLDAYRSHPAVFGDDCNIPESGNGVPDLLDEVKWELEWYKKMQDATGSTRGLFLKVGVTNWNSASPPSADANPRFYLGECTSATISGAAVFALASIVYRKLGGSWTAYADELLQRAQDAWSRASAVTAGFTTGFETTCDDQTIKAGDADFPEKDQKNMAFTAAVYLYEATANPAYKTYIDNRYTDTYPYSDFYWGPYYNPVQRALLRYAALPQSAPAGAPFSDSTVSAAIRAFKASQSDILSIDDYNNGTDLYRASMPATDYGWGSNRTKCYAALHNYDFVTFNINPSGAPGYKEAAESYLHYLHGVNPMGKMMLSNMYDYGGDNCTNEISHAWFVDGSPYDNALTSLYGPAPGFLTGGPNQDYPVPSNTPPYNQPVQKAYRDWNTDWNSVTSIDEASYTITEPSISNQAAYVALLARVIDYSNASVLPVRLLSFTAAPDPDGAALSWLVSEIDDLRQFVVERSFDGRSFAAIATVPAAAGRLHYTHSDPEVRGSSKGAWYRIRVEEAARTFYSGVCRITPGHQGDWRVWPNPANGRVWVQGQASGESTLFRVRSADGVLVQEWRSGGGSVLRSVDLSALPDGFYWLEVTDSGGPTRLPLIKRRG